VTETKRQMVQSTCVLTDTDEMVDQRRSRAVSEYGGLNAHASGTI